MPFVKGQSGNPSGKTKGVMDLAREIREKFRPAVLKAMAVLEQYADGTIECEHKDRLKAIELLAGRVLGPPSAPPPVAPDADDLAKANQLHVTVTYGKPPEPIPVVGTPDTDVT